MLEKTFQPLDVEKRNYDKWEKAKAFAADSNSTAKTFTIMMPPPNVTGSLHMGHALNYTLQDVLIRYHRLLGENVLWLPGTDHAGIATQMVVERQMDQENLSRHDLGREKFLERVWKWKEQSGDTIVNQQRRLGASPDWDRARFTMDQGLSVAVREVFVRLYKEGLIYRDRRLVNWDSKLHTAVSDLEVQQKEVNGHFWYIKYPVVGEKDRFITVATTRPETMFGDTAVAVHGEDDRYKDLIGKAVILPIANREIPVIADEHSDPEKGTGAVKITPAHDFNDFEVGKRHNLPMISIMDLNACLTDDVPPAYRGLDRFEARKKVVEELTSLGLLEKIEEKLISIPYGDRSGIVIEPRLTDQWFVDAKTLAQPAIQAVEQKRTQFVPAHWSATYFEWLKNIQPWCISRQIWWGHRIPAWYGPDGHTFVCVDEKEALQEATKHYGKAVELNQDPDVLDTWFSSALWPFSTLGWPEKTADLEKYYPGDVLVTGFDIIFFWVARMMMMGLHFMKEVPFKTVYINALVRDEKGQKMSKSKGNIIDPLILMDKFGADALRFCMAALAAPGVDVKFSETQVEGYRNFATKLWNSARFCEHYECQIDSSYRPEALQEAINQWIVTRTIERSREISDHLNNNRFDLAASCLYQFVWAEYCDWFVELAKPVLSSADQPTAKLETRQTAAWVLRQILIHLHPFMPFISEELWEKFFHEEGLLCQTSWPQYTFSGYGQDVKDQMDWLMTLITEIRAARSEVNIPPAAKLKLGVLHGNEQTQTRLEQLQSLVKRLARLEEISIDPQEGAFKKGVLQVIVGEATYLLPIGEVIDVEAESARLKKRIQEAEAEISAISKKLNNPQFVDRAPADVVAENKRRLDEETLLSAKFAEALKRLG